VVLHGFSYANYLAELGADAQKVIYSKSSSISPYAMLFAKCGIS
jgi:hypothetical protein